MPVDLRDIYFHFCECKRDAKYGYVDIKDVNKFLTLLDILIEFLNNMVNCNLISKNQITNECLNLDLYTKINNIINTKDNINEKEEVKIPLNYLVIMENIITDIFKIIEGGDYD